MNTYRTFGARIAAFIVDSIIYLPLGFISYLLWRVNMPEAISSFCILAITLTPTFYRIIMHVLFGQTVGKMMTNIKVLTDNEQTITINHAVLRSLPQIFFLVSLILTSNQLENQKSLYDSLRGVLMFFYLVWIFFDNVVTFCSIKRQSLHDWLAGTIVINTK